ncbi:hypothetical protein [Paraburkholderia unamae]|uniref:hypothetical protein n=1 Tax=Paraburkholderia unamae TaxID=219649 RepID=UPI00105780F4|nr:hypothetical protein [Paraburkholderia unamae]
MLTNGAAGKRLKVQQREDRSALTSATVDKMGDPVLFYQDWGGLTIGTCFTSAVANSAAHPGGEVNEAIPPFHNFNSVSVVIHR